MKKNLDLDEMKKATFCTPDSIHPPGENNSNHDRFTCSVDVPLESCKQVGITTDKRSLLIGPDWANAIFCLWTASRLAIHGQIFCQVYKKQTTGSIYNHWATSSNPEIFEQASKIFANDDE